MYVASRRDALVKEKMTPIVNAFMLCGTEKLSYKVSECLISRELIYVETKQSLNKVKEKNRADHSRAEQWRGILLVNTQQQAIHDAMMHDTSPPLSCWLAT